MASIFTTRINDRVTVVKRLMTCGVQDIPSNADEATAFGLSAEDIGDYIFHILQFYDLDFEVIEFIAGDNAYMNKLVCIGIGSIESIYHLRTESRKKLDGKSKKCIITEMPILLGIVRMLFSLTCYKKAYLIKWVFQ